MYPFVLGHNYYELTNSFQSTDYCNRNSYANFKKNRYDLYAYKGELKYRACPQKKRRKKKKG